MAEGSHHGDPQLSVVLSTLGNYPVLRRVLDGYARQNVAFDAFELIVVVDRADRHPEAVDEAIGSRPFAVRRLTGETPGLSANRNAGWPAARAPIVLLTDNDTIPAPGLVSQHLQWHHRYPAEDVAVVGHVRWARELRVTPFMRWLDDGMQFDYGGIDGIEAGWTHLYGANASIKKSFIERVGGWDAERLPYLYDDLDWAYRASKLGLTVRYNRRAVVEHLRTDMTLEFWKQKVRRLAAAEHRFTRIHPEIEPYFYGLFRNAAQAKPASGRGVRLVGFVPKWVPVLGPRAWESAGLTWKQTLAPHFLEAWEEAETAATTGQSEASGLGPSEYSSGSSPGGPK